MRLKGRTALVTGASRNIGRAINWDAQGGPWALVALGGEFFSPTM